MTAPAFAEWLETELRLRGWSQSKLAREIGTTPGTVNGWTTGRSKPTTETCHRIAAALGLPAKVVLEAADHLKVSEERSPYDAMPEWARLLPMLSRADADYVGRLVESLARNPAQPDPEPGPEEPQ